MTRDSDRIELVAPASPGAEELVAALARDDVLGQLLERAGTMRGLGSEGGEPKLDWIDGVERALASPELVAQCEVEARALLERGIRHVLWAGMGGSVQIVHVLRRLGLLDAPRLTVYPCDSTDPASLNRILQEIAGREGLASFEPRPELLARTAMIGVSMGMTSEEPITHLEWYDGLLESSGLPQRGAHIQVMTLPGSYLDRFAETRGSRRVPIQLDGRSGTPGRMSAPATRVFLVPAALSLAAVSAPPGTLEALLRRIHELACVPARFDAAARRGRVHADPFLRLAALIAERTRAGRNHVAVLPSPEWRGFEPWLEQLVEESLGKRGKGFCVFYGDQPWEALGTEPLRLRLGTEAGPDAALRLPRAESPAQRLALAGALCAGLELTIAAYGYLEEIVFAGQPGVEAYKAYARTYRDAPGDVEFGAPAARSGRWSLHAGARIEGPETQAEARRLGGDPAHAADLLAAVLSRARAPGGRLRYLDFTFNGEPTAELTRALEAGRRVLANGALALPAKIRTGPADYHSTEQSEVDGPNELVSIRLVALEHEDVLRGRYTDKFLLAQARGTWQAMEDAGRWIVMLTVPRLDGGAAGELERLFDRAAQRLSGS
jgi:hypothetical protein